MNHDEMLCKEYSSSNKADERAYQRDELIYNVTEDILILLEDMDVSKKELARRLGKSQSYVTQVLSGSRNMTLGSLSDICYALGKKVMMKINSHHFEESSELNASNNTALFHVNEYESPIKTEEHEAIYNSIISSSINRDDHYIIQKRTAVAPGLIVEAIENAKYELSGWHSLAVDALIHSGRNISVEVRGNNIIDRRDVNHWQKEVA